MPEWQNDVCVGKQFPSNPVLWKIEFSQSLSRPHWYIDTVAKRRSHAAHTQIFRTLEKLCMQRTEFSQPNIAILSYAKLDVPHPVYKRSAVCRMNMCIFLEKIVKYHTCYGLGLCHFSLQFTHFDCCFVSFQFFTSSRKYAAFLAWRLDFACTSNKITRRFTESANTFPHVLHGQGISFGFFGLAFYCLCLAQCNWFGKLYE